MIGRLFHDCGRAWDRFERKLTKKMDSGQRKLWDVFVFLLRFMLLAIPFNFLLWINFDAHSLQVLTAKAVSALLSFSGIENHVDDVVITVSHGFTWNIEIVKDCIGWKSFMAVAGLMFGVRGVRMKRRLTGILVAAPVVYVANIIRIFSSIYVPVVCASNSESVLGMFNSIHQILWQGGLIVIVIAIWWVWMVKYAYKK